MLDEKARPLLTPALADALDVKPPVLMVVEPQSLGWLSGQGLPSLRGERWAEEWAQRPNREQVTRDGGSCLSKGVTQLKRPRRRQGRSPVADQLDPFQVWREGGRGVGWAERAAPRAQVALVKAEAERAERQRQGQPLTGLGNRIRARRVRAARALEAWIEGDRLWQQAKAAVQPFTAAGEFSTWPRAEAVLAQTLPWLPDQDFRAAKHQLQRRQTLPYLDAVQRKLAALAVPAQVRRRRCVRRGGVAARRGAWPRVASGSAAWAAAVMRGGVGQGRCGRRAGGAGRAFDLAPSRSCQQSGGVCQERGAHAAVAASEVDSGSIGLETSVLQ